MKNYDTLRFERCDRAVLENVPYFDPFLWNRPQEEGAICTEGKTRGDYANMLNDKGLQDKRGDSSRAKTHKALRALMNKVYAIPDL